MTIHKSGVKFSWTLQQVGGGDTQKMDDQALRHAVRMWRQGYREGEVHITVSDDEGVCDYRGWWTAEED